MLLFLSRSAQFTFSMVAKVTGSSSSSLQHSLRAPQQFTTVKSKMIQPRMSPAAPSNMISWIALSMNQEFMPWADTLNQASSLNMPSAVRPHTPTRACSRIMKGRILIIFSLMLWSAGILTVKCTMMKRLQMKLMSSPTVKMGMARGRMAEYMKHMNSCRVMMAHSVGKSKGNIVMVALASFWMMGLLGSSWAHIFLILQLTNVRLAQKTNSWMRGEMAATRKNMVQQGEMTAYQSVSKSLKTVTLLKSMNLANLRYSTLWKPSMFPLRMRGRMAAFMQFETNTLTKMKLNSLGLLSGFSRCSATTLTTTIRITLVIADTADAPDWMMLFIRMSLLMLEQALSIVESVNVSLQWAEQQQYMMSLSPAASADWASERVVAVSKLEQEEVLETQSVQKAMREEVMMMQMRMSKMDRISRTALEQPEMSMLFQLYSSGLARLVDSIISSSFPRNFCRSGR